MGFRINKTSSWRAPLQIIDCFLPRQEASHPAPPVVARCLRSFQRAGWLGKARKTGGVPADDACERSTTTQGTGTQASPPMRVIHAPEQPIVVPRRPSARVVISGRMADVCAELERLAAMEARLSRA